MSNTDKDAPYWVRVRESGVIDHDHTRGVCVIADDSRGRWSFGRNHRRACAKYSEVEYLCTKDEPHGRAWSCRRTCWTTVCVCPIPDAWRDEDHACENRKHVACIGHTRREFNADVPCVCDDWTPATCYYVESDAERWSSWGGGGVPAWFVKARWHGPERTRERTGLGSMRREYNACGEIADYDFAGRQARGSARWDWH